MHCHVQDENMILNSDLLRNPNYVTTYAPQTNARRTGLIPSFQRRPVVPRTLHLYDANLFVYEARHIQGHAKQKLDEAASNARQDDVSNVYSKSVAIPNSIAIDESPDANYVQEGNKNYPIVIE